MSRRQTKTRDLLGTSAPTYIARPVGQYDGGILAHTTLHVLQKVGAQSAVAHFKARLQRIPAVGAVVQIRYVAGEHRATVSTGRAHATQAISQSEPFERPARAVAFEQLDSAKALARHPELRGAYQLAAVS